jgi:hypothetical protein
MAKFTTGTIRTDLKTMIDQSPYNLNNFMADKLLPPIAVTQRSGNIPLGAMSKGMKNLDLRKAVSGEYQQTESGFSDTSYATFRYGLSQLVDDIEDKEYKEIFDMERDAAENIAGILKIAREKRVASKLFSTTTFSGADDQQAVATDWLDDSCDIFTDIQNAVAKSKKKNGLPKSSLSLALSEDVFNQVMRSSIVRADVKYTKDIGSASKEAQAQYLANFLHLKEVNLLTAIADTLPEGAKDSSTSFSDIWDEDFALLYFGNNGGSNWGKGLGRQPYWKPFSSSFLVDSWKEPKIEGSMVRVREIRGINVFNKYGVLLTGVSS